MDKITVYTDGSALSNGRPGSGCGWACKLIYKGQARMKSGGAIGETNNRMEMQAVLEAMKSITDKTIPVEVYSDSNYVVETMNGHFAMKKNRDLWRKLMRERQKFTSIRFIWVKGHDKNQPTMMWIARRWQNPGRYWRHRKMDKYEAVKHLIEQGKDATLEDGVVMLRSRATGAALDREYKAMKKDLKAAGYNGSLGIRGVRREAEA